VDVIEAIRTRRSTRAFRPAPVREADIDRVLEAARLAPSAGNLQAYEIILVTPDALSVLAMAAPGHPGVTQAAAALVFCADRNRSSARYGRRGASLFAVQDATIACAYAQLAATELGLATLWIGAFDDDAVRERFGIEAGLSPIAILLLGHSAERPAPVGRRAIGELVRRVGGLPRRG
jgi:nitroreductase